MFTEIRAKKGSSQDQQGGEGEDKVQVGVGLLSASVIEVTVNSSCAAAAAAGGGRRPCTSCLHTALPAELICFSSAPLRGNGLLAFAAVCFTRNLLHPRGLTPEKDDHLKYLPGELR